MSIENRKISQEELENVSGGCGGGSREEKADREDAVKYLYEVGQEVEVYDNPYHITTEHATIIARRAKCIYGTSYIGEYQVHYRDAVSGIHTQDDWVTADDIE